MNRWNLVEQIGRNSWNMIGGNRWNEQLEIGRKNRWKFHQLFHQKIGGNRWNDWWKNRWKNSLRVIDI